MHHKWTCISACFFAFLIALAAQSASAEELELAAAKKTFDEGNYSDAYDAFSRLALATDHGLITPAEATTYAIRCLQQLNRENEIDDFREEVAAVHEKNWRVLAAVARSYIEVNHQGYLIAGKFLRGPHRGGGNVANALARDRVRAMQHFQQARILAQYLGDKVEPAAMLRLFAQTVLGESFSREPWRLQELTDLATLPDYEEGWGYSRSVPQGAPVDVEGSPILFDVPDSWDAAENDGQRWRWLLEEIIEWQPTARSEVLMTRARFLESQFGVQTLSQYGILLPARDDDATTQLSSIFALETLSDEETIARLATGIKRFTLPDEHNHIKLYQQIVEIGVDSNVSLWGQTISQLGTIFENRRQFPRAAEYWKQGAEAARKHKQLGSHYQDRYEQITGNWARFDSVMTQPAGRGATVDFRYRNGKRVEFVAQEIKVKTLLDDVKAYLKSNPNQLDWQQIEISEIGYRLVDQKQEKYVGDEVARWSLDLTPREKHFDKRMTVTTPLQKHGAYLLTARMQDGNTSKIVIWLADTAIVKKPLFGKTLYYIADAVTGKPIPKANVELFGYRQEQVDGRQFRVVVQNLAEASNADGQVVVAVDPEKHSRFAWLTTATTPDGRFAYLGFHGVWAAQHSDALYDATKAFFITDRPVYRPKDSVQFKVWVRRALYGMEERSSFAHQAFLIEIRNPKDEVVFKKNLTADLFGGMAGTFELTNDAALGQYRVSIPNRGEGYFRVEEYKKPEFEVTVESPTEPLMLGEKFSATIRAKYYFGSPVAEGRVRYNVLRSDYDDAWFPPMPWDWLYGKGYWWFAYDYNWYPGWNRWGSSRPTPSWIWRSPAPPEVVAEDEVELNADGTIQIEIDTAIAKALYPDRNQRYQIEAEVTDLSRRTIVGSGEVLVARKPFQVFAWVDRGYYRVGDTIDASLAARRLDGKPVQGAGKLRLLRLRYGDDGKPTETEVRAWELPSDVDGRANMQIKASEPGQYRISYEVTDKAAHTVEGGYIFTIVGDAFEGSDFHFNDLEIIPGRREYAPGDTVRLQINTNRVGSTVLLFVRAINGAYPSPQVIRLDGKSTIVEITVEPTDKPNFFVEALTVADGRVHTQIREIFVPPVQRVLDVDVEPSATSYLPGQKASLKLKLTGTDGKPFVGSTVVAVYDKSIEYISGGSNVPDIREFFWKWTRSHRPILETNLGRITYNLLTPDTPAMEDLGAFGGLIDLMTSTVTGESWGQGGAIDLFVGGTKMRRAAPAAAAFADNSAGAAPELVQPTVRTDFADTAYWNAALETDSDGLATVEFDMPDSLTTWKINIWGMGHGTKVGQATAEVVTRKNLIVRMQAPRFFVETDEVVLSANVHNYLPDAKSVEVRLELDDNQLERLGESQQTVEIEPNGEKRVDWRVRVVREGEAVIRMLALTDAESDAVEMRFPVYVHGMLKTDSYTGSLRPNETLGNFTVTVPDKRRADQTRLEVRYSPTLAGAMVDAIPYLVDYPYGCTEQTLNRFLPAVVTQQTLIDMGLDLEDIQKKRANLNPQELGDAAERAEGWRRYERNPVFDKAELTTIVKTGVERLTEMQLSDGGWGWFSGMGERSTPHTTALVVHGLQIARANDVAIVPGVLDRGVAWLAAYEDEQIRALKNIDASGKLIDSKRPAKLAADNVDALVYMVLADADVANAEMRDLLYRDRAKLAVYGLAMYGLALNTQNQIDKRDMVMRNIRQYVVLDDENQTAHLNLPQDMWWYWYGSEYEAHAYYLKLLVAVEPQSDVAPRLVKYLLNNRKHATYWNSTRDTALVVEAFADYLKATGETKPDLTVEVWVDGEKRKEIAINADNLFSFDNSLILTGNSLASGRHTVELRKRGTGPLYYNGYLTNFTLEDDIPAAGLELKVARKFYKLTPKDKTIQTAGSRGQVVDRRVEAYDRQEIPNLGLVQSGDLVEIELTIDSKNDYEYILLEDMKAAGMETVGVRSGYEGNELGAYVEYRDNRVVLFLRQLARGTHSVTYRMRAEIPGRFSALPAKIYGMYAPELVGNSDELKVRIED